MATDLGIRVSQQARPLARVSMEKPCDTNAWVYSTAYKYDILGHPLVSTYGPTWYRNNPRGLSFVSRSRAHSTSSNIPIAGAILSDSDFEFDLRDLLRNVRKPPANSAYLHRSRSYREPPKSSNCFPRYYLVAPIRVPLREKLNRHFFY